MRDRRDRRITLTAAGALALLAGGCAHNDVLVFGTSTTIGLNVETASSQGAAPSIVLGYEREEAVWMPLLVNGQESVLPLCPVGTNDACVDGPYPLDQAMYRSTIMDRTGQRVVQTDAYSVFASLGARFNGRANASSGAESGGGLAQFFATGNAAVNVSQNEALMTALKLESAEGAQAQAEAIGYAAALTAADRARIDDEIAQSDRELSFVLQCATQPGKDWAAIVNGSTLPADIKGVIAALPAAQRQPTLRGQDHWITPLATSAVSAGCQR